MLSVEAWTTIRYLASQGKGKKTITRELGVSRNTVRRALAREGPPRYERAKRPNPQLEPWRETIRRMRQQGFIGTRILRELRSQPGTPYQGSRSAFYAYLAQLQAEEPDPRASRRFETPPGQQAQFDWSPYVVDLGGVPTRVVVFSWVLGYSRRKHFHVSLDGRQASIFEAVEESLQHTGGAPQEVLVDNDGSLVTDARPAHFRWNPRFLELCGHYRLQPVACPVREPRVKGKVERPFYSLEQQVIRGGQWRDFAHFCADVARYEAEVNEEVHGTTRERPEARFLEERAALTPLPGRRARGLLEERRKVSWDGLVSFRGNKYGVPATHAGQQVWVRPSQGYALEVTASNGACLARHVLASGKGAMVLLEGQYDGLRQGRPRTWAVLRQAFLDRFPRHRGFLDRLYQRHQGNAAAQLRSILDLARLYPREPLEEAFLLAQEHQACTAAFVRGVVEQRQPQVDTTMSTVRSLRPVPAVTVHGDLSPYQRLLAVGRGR